MQNWSQSRIEILINFTLTNVAIASNEVVYRQQLVRSISASLTGWLSNIRFLLRAVFLKVFKLLYKISFWSLCDLVTKVRILYVVKAVIFRIWKLLFYHMIKLTWCSLHQELTSFGYVCKMTERVNRIMLRRCQLRRLLIRITVVLRPNWWRRPHHLGIHVVLIP